MPQLEDTQIIDFSLHWIVHKQVFRRLMCTPEDVDDGGDDEEHFSDMISIDFGFSKQPLACYHEWKVQVFLVCNNTT